MYRLEEYLAGRWYSFAHSTKEPTPRGSPLRSAGTGESDMRRKMFVRKNT